MCKKEQWTVDMPPPGSDAAFKLGCICATMDNHYGDGRGGDGERWGWFMTGGCKLHDKRINTDGALEE